MTVDDRLTQLEATTTRLERGVNRLEARLDAVVTALTAIGAVAGTVLPPWPPVLECDESGDDGGER